MVSCCCVRDCNFIACRAMDACTTSASRSPASHSPASRAHWHRARRHLLPLSFFRPPPPFRATAVTPRCHAHHRWVRLCALRCHPHTVHMSCTPPRFHHRASRARHRAWARTAARQCCRMDAWTQQARAGTCRAPMCLVCGAIRLKIMSKASV